MPEVGLSRATFAKLSPHPYLLANLEPSNQDIPPARSNGRAPDEARTPEVNLSSLSHAHGSSLVRIGDTTAICGVRGETILTANIPNYRASNAASELRDYDLLVPNIELATGSSPQNLPGGPPSTLAQTLSTRVYSLLHSSQLLDAADFRIWHTQTADLTAADDEEMQDADADADGEDQAQFNNERQVIAYWVLYIDIFFISLDGNQFDAAWAATLAALRDTKLPRARYDPDSELIVCSRKDPKPLSLNGFPIACTAAVFTGKETDRPTEGKYWVLVDPDTLEESLCDESLTVVADCSGGTTSLLSVSKHGGTVLTPKHLRSKQLLGFVEKRWKGFADAMSV
ncbi:ribosomal protein S5 domain 2-type fold domain containing protein [Cordyceps fumosorosea ARSEF 2679]|uniref:Ribosomal RNA-processing protein 43 n=1 Tax=Cordyceps fumosorosea (strain ARSEF 2679) TaxID=1081104 RepID=A0A167MC44_CORFA|nr:ribosomal protein S5 domain 2-type fold domain containing protein [Cordyceps fumosorosea ARSEF 2679]OAA54188.1 ribosomal protein S5 domain 2-type fold domain containing protein [Cordyceps fumosorosea ARSEF 2679]